MPLRAAASLASSLLVEAVRNTDTGDWSALHVPWWCVQIPQHPSLASPSSKERLLELPTSAVSRANILDRARRSRRHGHDAAPGL